MELPIELQHLIADLGSQESDELTELIDRFSSDDEEMHRLIFENLDSLIQAVEVT